MIDINEALHIVLTHASLLPATKLHLLESDGLVLAEEVHSPWDIPAADNSAMDGYAYFHNSVQGEFLPVCDFLPAGNVFTGTVPAGSAIKIMTGAQIPLGCDTVVPIEDVQEVSDGIKLKSTSKPEMHIRKRGEDVGADDLVFIPGTLIRPQEIGMLASFGKTEVSVYRRPVVAIIATGDELVEPGEKLTPGKIVNCNSYCIASQVKAAGGVPMILGIARDNREATRKMLQNALSADVVITSGGVSVGDYDFVKEVIIELGGELKFWKINMKPGKPLAFGVISDKPIFALPGNPVAAMVGFELFVRPSLLTMMGHTRVNRPFVSAIATEPICNDGKRPHLMRVLVEQVSGKYYLKSTGNQGSARISSMTHGNALVLVPSETAINSGDTVNASLIGSCIYVQNGCY